MDTSDSPGSKKSIEKKKKPLYFEDYIFAIEVKQKEIRSLLNFLLENFDRLQKKE